MLFRDRTGGAPMLDIPEFPALVTLADQIEWRDAVTLAGLPDDLARFDINLAPLETGNPYCEAKSELRFFEAALAGVCTVASPTEPMARAIRHRAIGMLAATNDAWYQALVALVDDTKWRQRMARAAYLDVLWQYGPRRRAELMLSLLSQLAGGQEAARAFELEFRRSTAGRKLPDLPAADTVFASDRLGTAEVSIVIPLYNYAGYIAKRSNRCARRPSARST